ncbi:uncharacterized protein MELLADRAFT_70701 [Melampsora larici-populina 98AG31]|uniref:Uncharacterized protein n=1 Tax=Melampsora larici-populina (strain 98AG31 / pathotype 3-4-7) TaxID=747676 RepID=F4R5P9_MELLP|nr:uncharacterized protein MELLADRAFT_70701 [Melampsora larici-populina 98AG31]EGG12224.1 hypothetical protein MELLADRAFT_70701 [Melampsora larici-populina 98AG31]
MGLLGVSETNFAKNIRPQTTMFTSNISRQPSTIRKIISSTPLQKLVNRKTLKRQTRSQFTTNPRPTSMTAPLLSTNVRVGMTGYTQLVSSNENQARRSENLLDQRLPVYEENRLVVGVGMVFIQEFNDTIGEIDFDQWARFCM